MKEFNILVAHSHEPMQSLLRDILNEAFKKKVKVSVASTFQQASIALDGKHLLIVDHELKGKGGETGLDLVKVARLKNIGVIATSTDPSASREYPYGVEFLHYPTVEKIIALVGKHVIEGKK